MAEARRHQGNPHQNPASLYKVRNAIAKSRSRQAPFSIRPLPRCRNGYGRFTRVGQGNGGVPAMGSSKQPALGYRTAWAMPHKIRKAMAQRDGEYTLAGFIELDGVFSAGAAKGRGGRGAANKTPVLAMVESRAGHAGFIAMQTVPPMEKTQAETVIKENIAPGRKIRTDGCKSYPGSAGMGHRHGGAPVLAENACEDPPRVHPAISNAKRSD